MSCPANQPLFSLVTVVRNDLAGLMQTRDSLCGQRFRDFEWIVVDGDSEDGCRAFLQAHAAEIAWWRSAPDGGIYHAMNIGLAAAQGSYVVFLNAGDTLADIDTLTVFFEALSSGGWPDFCYGDAWEAGSGQDKIYKPARHHHFAWYGMFTHHQAMLYRRTGLDGLWFDTAYRIGADYAFTLNALNRSRAVLRVRRPFCVFSLGGCSQTQASTGRKDQALIRKHVLNHGFIRRFGVSLAQSAAVLIRSVAPSVFYTVRCRRPRQDTRYGF